MKCSEVILFFLIVTDFAFCKHAQPKNITMQQKHLKPKQLGPKQLASKKPVTKQLVPRQLVPNHTKHLQPSQITINIKMHFDKPLTQKLTTQHKVTPGKIKHYLSTKLLQDVEKYFRHPSLNQTIRFNLLEARLLKNSSSMDENVSNYLRNYCEWQARKKAASKVWFYSVLLTGLDVFYVNEKNMQIRKSTARSYMRSICTASKSCTVLEWHPQHNAHLLAHEIAHSLGVQHDGEAAAGGDACRGHKHVMSARYSPRRAPATWSTCSRRQLRRLLKSRATWCLRLT